MDDSENKYIKREIRNTGRILNLLKKSCIFSDSDWDEIKRLTEIEIRHDAEQRIQVKRKLSRAEALSTLLVLYQAEKVLNVPLNVPLNAPLHSNHDQLTDEQRKELRHYLTFKFGAIIGAILYEYRSETIEAAFFKYDGEALKRFLISLTKLKFGLDHQLDTLKQVLEIPRGKSRALLGETLRGALLDIVSQLKNSRIKFSSKDFPKEDQARIREVIISLLVHVSSFAYGTEKSHEK